MADQDLRENLATSNKDEFTYCTCSPCSETDTVTDATHYCPECDVCYCKACLCDHSVIGRALIHQWGKSKPKQPCLEPKHEAVISPSSEGEKCLTHPVHHVQFYCEKDDVLCCKICISTNHRNCSETKTVDSITKYEKFDDDIKHTREMRKVVDSSIKLAINEIKLRKKLVESSHKKYAERLEDYRRKTNEVFDNISSESVKVKEYLLSKIEGDKLLCQTALNELPQFEVMVQESDDISQKFLKLKRSKEWAKSNVSMLTKIRNTINIEKENFEVIPDKNIENTLAAIRKQGKITMGLARYSIRMNDDKTKCQLFSICILADEKMVLSDTANRRLKILDKNLDIICSYEFSDSPKGLCVINETDVAVGMDSSMIKIVRVSDIVEVLRSLKIENDCSYIAYANDALFIASIKQHQHSDKAIRIYKYNFHTGENIETLEIKNQTRQTSTTRGVFNFGQSSTTGFSFGVPLNTASLGTVNFSKQVGSSDVVSKSVPLRTNGTHMFLPDSENRCIFAVCDMEGNKLGTSITYDDFMQDIYVDDQDNVYVCSGDHVNKYDVKDLSNITNKPIVSVNAGKKGMLSIVRKKSVGRIIIGCKQCDFIYMV